MGKELSALESFLSKDKRGVEWRTESLVVSERGVFSILGGAPFFATCSLMALSQLPTVLALSGADAELAAAGTLSTLVATAWAKYVARSHISEVDIGPATVFTVQGDKSFEFFESRILFCQRLQLLSAKGGINQLTRSQRNLRFSPVFNLYEV